MRDLDSFNEWQLGIIKSWADTKNAQMLVRHDRKYVSVVRGRFMILYWHYGQEPALLINDKYWTLSSLVEYAEELNNAFAYAADIEWDSVIATLRQLQHRLGGASS